MLRLALLAFSVLTTVTHVTSTGISVWRRGRAKSARHPQAEGAKVSVVRPACGLDDIERATLASSFDLDPEQVELIFCCAREHDAAVPYLRGLVEEHPTFEARVCIGDDLGTPNPKLNNMAKGWRVARHPWVLFSDSNLMLPRDYVDRVLDAWRPDTGVVCVPPIGVAPVGFWSELECAFLNTSHARWQLTVDALGTAFAQGKTMLFRRADLEAFGGVEALASELAEDAAATKHVRAAGLRVRLADPTFGQPLGHRSAAQVVDRQLRWAQLRRTTFPLMYLPEAFGGCVFPIAAGVAAAEMGGFAALPVLCALTALWLGAELVLALRWRWPVSVWSPAAWLARDLLAPVIWIFGWTTRGYRWRGNDVERVATRPFIGATNRNALTTLLGVASLAAVIAVVVHIGDGKRVLALFAHAETRWLAVALLLQVANFPVKAAVFAQALRAHRLPFARLCQLAVVALYTSATVPSAGLAGTWLTLRVLQWWGAPPQASVAAVWVDILGHYAAYAIVVGAAVAVEWRQHALSPAIGGTAAALGVVAMGLALVAFGSHRWRHAWRRIARWPLLAQIGEELSSADPTLLRNPSVLGSAIALRAVNFALDVATLWACLAAAGVTTGPGPALCALVVGALARTIGLVPSGMGTFEAAVVATYASFGVALEPALAAALLFRGFSFWLPIVPGLWWSRNLLAPAT